VGGAGGPLRGSWAPLVAMAAPSAILMKLRRTRATRKNKALGGPQLALKVGVREGGEREGLEGECWGGPNPRERVGGGGEEGKGGGTGGREERVEGRGGEGASELGCVGGSEGGGGKADRWT